MLLLKSANPSLHISKHLWNVQAQSLKISLGARLLNCLALTFKLDGKSYGRQWRINLYHFPIGGVNVSTRFSTVINSCR